jgi:hypothetical protein
MGLIAGRRDIHRNATIRLVPKIMIGDHKAADSFCPLTYEWKSADKDIIPMGEWSTNDERYTNSGINITGLNKGTAVIELTTRLHSSRKELASAKAIIKVVDITNVTVPTYIGHDDAIPNYLILPPHSSYSFPSEYRIRLLSPCDKSINVHQNTIETFDDKKSAAIQVSSLSNE